MKILTNIWFACFLINLFLLMWKTFEVSESKIVFSIWAKSLVVNISLVISVMMIGSYISNNPTLSLNIVLMFGVVFSYMNYAVFIFRYDYGESSISWFNGLYLIRIMRQDIAKIIFHKQNDKVIKFIFHKGDRKIKMRNDLRMENTISTYAHKHNIPVINQNN